MKSRAIILLTMFLIVFSVLVYRALGLTLGEANELQTNLALMNRSPISLELLNRHVDELEVMIGNIEDTPFSVIKNAIEKTITLIHQSNLELKTQYEAWAEIQRRIKRDDVNFKTLKNQLAQLQEIEDERIIKDALIYSLIRA